MRGQSAGMKEIDDAHANNTVCYARQRTRSSKKEVGCKQEPMESVSRSVRYEKELGPSKANDRKKPQAKSIAEEQD